MNSHMPKLFFQFHLKKESKNSEAQKELLSYEVENLSFMESDEGRSFFGQGIPSAFPTTWKSFTEITPLSDEINWQEQWELFCPFFQNGLCKIPLNTFKKESSESLLLNPGPGFGDLSHPTTLLMLELTARYCQDKTVIDLGCGSGIIGLAALKFGAKKSYSLDIDPLAIKHAEENALSNNLAISTTLPHECPDLLCLNMIFPEQQQAINSLPYHPKLWLTSGILKKEKTSYLKFVETLGLQPLAIESKEAWLAFVLTKSVL